MRILKMIYPTGHPYWNEGEFNIIMPNGDKYDMHKHRQYAGHGYKIDVRKDGVYYILHDCGSGYGKVTNDKYPPIKIISSTEYDKIQYIGNELVISDTLKKDLAENAL